MSQLAYTLPNVVTSGMFRKINEAHQTRIDGHPATSGMPMEFELRHYYNYYIPQEKISFESFLTLLSFEISKRFTDIQFSVEWVRECDKLRAIDIARRAMARLRAYVQSDRYSKTSFWDTLWGVSEVSLKKLGLSYLEVGTSTQELALLSWRYLIKECQARIEMLRNLAQGAQSVATQKAFLIVDDMLHGTPIACDDFCNNRHTHYSRACAYPAYKNFADGRTIPLENVGWSSTEHESHQGILFPYGLPKDRFVESEAEPTAPATADSDDAALRHTPPDRRNLATRSDTVRENKDPRQTSFLNILTELVESTLPSPRPPALGLR